MVTFDPNAAAAPGSGVFGLPHTPDEAKVVLVPVPFEATTSYGGGTSKGPEAIYEASRQVDLFDLETGKPYEQGIAMLDLANPVAILDEKARALTGPIIEAGGATDGDAGTIKNIDALCAGMNDWVYERNRDWIARGKFVGTIGGDHSTSFGAIRAHVERYPELGVLHVDAHADLRQAYEGFTWSHASIMFNVVDRLPVKKLVQVAIRDFCEEEFDRVKSSNGRIVSFYDAELARARFGGRTWLQQVDEMVAALPKEVYVSFDIDGLDPVLCPSTGTPVPGGLQFHEATALIAGVVRSGRRIVGFDLNEVAPGEDEWDGNVGARLLYKLIGWTLKGQR